MGISVNEQFYGWSDCEFSAIINDRPAEIVAEMSAMNWGHATTITNVYGSGRTPIGQVVGTYVPEETTITFFQEKWATLKQTLGDGWQGMQIAMKVKFRKPGGPLQEVVVEGRISGESQGLSQGDEAVTVDIKVVPILITTDGVKPYQTDGVAS